MNQRSFFSWIIKHFSYLQIYIFFCFLFFLSLLPIGSFWVVSHLTRASLIDEQLEVLNEESALRDLLNELQQHRLLMQRFYTNHQEGELEIETLQSQIHLTFQQAAAAKKLIEKYPQYTQLIWQKVNPQKIETEWNALVQQMSNLTAKQSEKLHTKIIQNLLIQITYLSDKLGVSYSNEVEYYALIESVLLRIPQLQENLSQLILLSENALISQGKNLSRDRLETLMNLVESDLSYIKQGIELHVHLFPSKRHHELLEALINYSKTLDSLLNTVKNNILSEHPPHPSLIEFDAEGATAMQLGYELWTRGFDHLQYIFHKEKSIVLTELWGVLLITFLLACFAFLFGLILIHKGTSRLSQLIDATTSFTNGNFSTRVPVSYQDEIGRLGLAFNQMAQKLEEIIKHLFELLNATTSLANGDLTARIPSTEANTQFDQVAQSFNKMAENFENIIGRLQKIGIVLSTSASEIATASKEQETIVVEQEATTREIAVAANEISSTAKEFAITMNEVNQNAEQTSNLALQGKGSLNHMESIMRQMVDASRSIASKLAVLNEKAGNITGVITTITKVADQTNLLSLNASIEAEKAGEYGRSFAVIAREIRRLADQTAIATLDIENMINEMMTAVSSSVMGVDDFTQEIRNGVDQVSQVSGQLAKIIEQVQSFTSRFELVNQGMQAQSTGAEQINEAIAQLSLTAQQTSEAIHHFHRTIQDLNNAAKELQLLTATIQSHANSEDINRAIEKEKTLEPFFEPTTKEKKRQFNKTLTNLNVTAAKLKNLNIQLHSQRKKNESSQNGDRTQAD